MDNIERNLLEEKKRIDNLEAPRELESRLQTALQTSSERTWKLKIWPTIVAALVLMMFVGYNFNAFAYYGKKILGFDDILSGTLRDLNEAGMGQEVDKTYPLGSGAELTINGIMSDENRMIVYYIITRQKGLQDSSRDIFQPQKITGFFTSSHYEGGGGMFNETRTEYKGTMDFEPVSPFSKKLTLHYWESTENGQLKEESISFPYDPNKAMPTNIKQSIKKTVKVDKGTIKFDSIVASPTLTVIKGSINVTNFDRADLTLHGIELIANGKPVDIMGSGSGTTLLGGREFDIRFDTLPQPLDSLVLNVKEFVGYNDVDKKISLQQKTDEAINVGGEELWIKEVSSSSKGMEVTIVTGESTLLDDVYIEVKNEKVPLETTINQTLNKEQDGRIMKERTLLFETSENPENLIIGGIHYMKGKPVIKQRIQESSTSC